jgi:hypothetical protein
MEERETDATNGFASVGQFQVEIEQRTAYT